MDVKKVYVIVDRENYTVERVKQEIREEGYPYEFFFGNGHEFSDLYMKEADEVWLFGNCKDIPDYKFAKEIGSDIWVMGV